ncbi:MAG: hypothetical protein SWH54_17900 [Thermodesulfobacteriota bacterium]|nr:hypothetical protein [Thermodesulfobacteriota bacterium]
MKQKHTPPGDEFQIRCPRLGHQISFSYCRIENNGQPCFKTFDCWYQHFQVEDFLKKELSEEEFNKISRKQVKPKVLSLLEMIEQAKKSKQK